MVQYLRVHIEVIKVAIARSETILSVKVLVPIMIIFVLVNKQCTSLL